jgi:hypothetical protein
MTITVHLTPATAEKLHAQAAASGKDVETFVREAVEAKLAITGRSFRDIMAPVHEDFRKSGMTEEELSILIDEETAAVRAERKASRTQQ